MTVTEAKQLIHGKSSNFSGNGALEYYNGNMSNFSGNGAIEYYMGNGNPSLEFFGGPGSSLIDVQDAEPFVLQVVNANASTAIGFYLSQGFLYTRGSESAGQLRTGTFAGINDTGTVTSLTASTSNSITIEQFIAYSALYPTYVPLIQATSTSATAQLSTQIQHYRQGMIKNEAPITIPWRKYAQGDQYNLQFQDLKEPLFISQQDIISIYVAASSTLTLNIYPLASKNSRKTLSNDVDNAKKLVSMPGAAEAIRAAVASNAAVNSGN